MRKKPGVMIYFEMLEVLKRMSLEDAGRIAIAILEYGQNYVEPSLPENLAIFWPIVQQRLDNDECRYQEVTTKRSYAAYVRWQKDAGKIPLSYEQWLKDPDQPTSPEPFFS